MLEKLFQKGLFPSPLLYEGLIEAKALFAYALCENKSACGECASCKKLSKDFHPDLLQADGSLKMEELRNLLARLRQKPMEARYRVLWFQNFQEASSQVQNALLKTLEEPLSHWIIFLQTLSVQPVLPTILSRCLVYRDPSSMSPKALGPEEQSIFNALKEGDSYAAFSLMEDSLKTREHAKALFTELLTEASRQNYPGHWENLSEALLQALEGLDRNLHPKVVWERAWSESEGNANELVTAQS